MRRRSSCCLIGVLLLVSIGTTAQRNPLRLQKGSKGFYLNHQVTAKQSFFSLGRTYNVHPRYLAAYNQLDYNKGLQLDQRIRVPLTDTNFQRQRGEGIPIYLQAATDDELADLAGFVGILPGDLKCWNNYTGNRIKKGSNWIVGFLQTQALNDQQVRIACNAKSPTPSTSPAPPSPSLPTVLPTPSTPATPSVVSVSSGSFFETAYREQIQQKPVSQQLNLMASVFKTSSGWQDAKYYVLIDNLVPGTIVKLINPANQQEAYAKVLGEMSRIRQNEGLDIRISNAAAAVLGVPEGAKFNLMIHY